MTEHEERDRRDEGNARAGRPRVKVTDKRRVGAGEPGRGEEPAPAEPSPEDELERVQKEAAEYLEHLQRLKAEFDNYRKRVLREQTQAVELASGPLMAKMLEVVDEFELALGAAEQAEHSPEAQGFVRGVEMVYAKLMDILKSEGLQRIEAEGRPFDPELHEALLQGEGQGEPYVEDVLRTGYTLKGRVLRPAGVKVARR